MSDTSPALTPTGKALTDAILEVVDPPTKGDAPVHIATRTASGGIETTKGTLYVSKPVRSSNSKKLRAMISFEPRKSHFDIANEKTASNEFRGFFTLFWMSMFLLATQTYIRSIEKTGYPLPMAFAHLFTEDAITVALSDAVLVLSTGLCVPFVKAISKGWINYYWTGVILQHVWQTAALFLVISWTFNRQWPWVQSGYLTLHCLVMIMKIHSYININGYLSLVRRQADKKHQKLQKLVAEIGDWDDAVALAQTRRKELDEATDRSDDSTPADTPPFFRSSASMTASSLSEVSAEAVLRKRLNLDSYRTMSTSISPNIITTGNHVLEPREVSKPGPHPLVDHPDEQVATLAQEWSELDSELISTGPNYIRWPNNITVKNFADYMLIPTLVYELEYPRTEKIRPLYVFEKTVATFGTFALLYTVTESFILPLTPTRDQSFFRSLLDLALPFMVAYLLLFYIIFECICNGFAELSRFADRQFYEDWVWNATSWDEFSRKWNKPVHTFLLRHVYASSMSSYKLSRQSAMFLTFLLSAAVHELVMAVVTKKIRMYLFFMQLAQIPLIAVGRIPFIKRNKLLGNVVFWIGLYAGFPFLCVAYCAY